MSKPKRRAASTKTMPTPTKAAAKTPRRRSRQAPPWLTSRPDLDAIAKRRCLLMLSVWSGEQGVMQAVEQAEISPTTFQQLETRALEAMLTALTPATSGEGEAATPTPLQRIGQLEAKVAELEREKRRAERLLMLTRKVVKPGPFKTAMGRPPKARARPSSTTPGSRPSRTSTPTSSPPTPTSIPTAAGEAER